MLNSVRNTNLDASTYLQGALNQWNVKNALEDNVACDLKKCYMEEMSFNQKDWTDFKKEGVFD